MAKIKYYAIRNGRESNLIVTNWDKASELITGYHNAEYKSFSNEIDAKEYLKVPKTFSDAKSIGQVFIYCMANCEMQIAGRCTQHIVNINKDGQCTNY